MKYPYFTIVIPIYNRAFLLKRCLTSIVTQTFTNYEVIICDDGSTDDCYKITESFANIIALTYLYDENWGGPARPRNRGIKAARGEWVCFLDSDDWWYPDKLEKISQFTNQYDVIHHDCDIYSKHGHKFLKARGRQLLAPVFVDLMTGWNGLHTSTVCVRRQLLQECEGFSEDRNLIAIEDFDLWLRLSEKTDRFLHIPQSLGGYWIEEDGISAFSEKSLQRERAVFEKYVSLLNPAFTNYAEKMFAYRQGIIYWHLHRRTESRQMFCKSLWPKKWRNRFLVPVWIAATFLPARHKT